MSNSLPHQIQKYFWGDSLQELNWPTHKEYIVQTLLDKGDMSAVKWLFTVISKLEVLKLLPNLKLSPTSAQFWQMYLA